MSRTAAIVLNWNGGADTLRCLSSLEAVRAEWWKTIVVDNGSEDGSPDRILRDFPWVELVPTGSNLGYAGGNNTGIRMALALGAEEVFVLNNDATVAPGTIAGLAAAARRDPSLGLVGPAVYRADGTFWHAGGRISWRPFRAEERADVPLAEAGAPRLVDYVPGCALLARAEVLSRIGLFDERLFLTWEDTELALRARAIGFRAAVLPAVRVEHLGSRSFERLFSPLYSYYYFRNMLLVARLHLPRGERARAYRDALEFARRVVRRRAGDSGRIRLTRAIVLGFVHFALGRFGEAPKWLSEPVRLARVDR
jgi:hypothetical protein